MARLWVVSTLLGHLTEKSPSLIVSPGNTYWVRLNGLAPRVVEALDDSFLSDHPLAGEPLVLEHVPFQVRVEETRWSDLATYPALLTNATPKGSISMAFRSPTGFRRRDSRFLAPEPRLCLIGYVRKRNTFGDVRLPEEQLLAYAQDHMALRRRHLRSKTVGFGTYAVPGVQGEVEWEADGDNPALLRLVNALADYAAYCGTGLETTQGMGQTVRV